MRKRIRSLLLPMLLVLPLLGSTCNTTQDPDPGDPFCEAPVYDPGARTVAALLDASFLHDVEAGFEDPNSHPASYAIIVAGLPPGLSLHGDTGMIDGVPTELGSWTAIIGATVVCEDGEELSDQLELTIDVIESCPPIDAPPSVTIDGELGVELLETLGVSGGMLDLHFAIDGELPPVLGFDSNTGEFSGTPTQVGTWEYVVTVTDGCVPEQSEEIDVTINVSQSAETVPLGVYDVATDGVEVIIVVTDIEFGGVEPPYVVISGTNGWAVLDLDSPLFTPQTGSEPWGAYWGAIPLAGGPAAGGVHTTRAMFAHGPAGSEMTAWDEQLGEWGWTVILQFNSVVDAAAIDGPEPDDQWLSYVVGNISLVGGIYYDTGSGDFVTHPGTINANNLGGAAPVSASPLSADSRELFVLTKPTANWDWSLSHADLSNPYADATPIANTGSDPVQVRVEGDIFAVSDFTDNTVTCGLVNQGTDAVVTITVTVGDGPYRMDLLALDDGNTAVACAGFDDDSYSVIVVDPLGQEVSSFTQALPGDISQPGGVAFLRDGSNNLIVGGHGSGNLAVVDTGL